MKRSKPSPAALFWCGLASYIIIADAILLKNKHDTMSICFGHWTETPRGKIACALGTGAIVSHLFWKTPLPLQQRFRLFIENGKVIKIVYEEEKDIE